MFAVRIHGRGGQGAVTAAELRQHAKATLTNYKVPRTVVFRDDQYLPVQGQYASDWRADPARCLPAARISAIRWACSTTSRTRLRG